MSWSAHDGDRENEQPLLIYEEKKRSCISKLPLLILGSREQEVREAEQSQSGEVESGANTREG